MAYISISNQWWFGKGCVWNISVIWEWNVRGSSFVGVCPYPSNLLQWFIKYTEVWKMIKFLCKWMIFRVQKLLMFRGVTLGWSFLFTEYQGMSLWTLWLIVHISLKFCSRKKNTTRDRHQIEIYGGAIDFFMRGEFYESLRVVYDTFLADYKWLLLFENLE